MPHNLQAITTAFYGNYACVDQDNILLFRCDEKKKNWYISRKLAEMISDNPPTFRLLFTPKGKGHHGDEFFLQDRKNQCVVCGTLEDLTRHHVVPHSYRRFFPKEYNRFGSYDVMMLCEADHVAYEYYSAQFRLKLADQYDAPVSGIKFNQNFDSRIIGVAFALLRHGDKIPQPRKEILATSIRKFLDREEFTEEDLTTITNIKQKTEVKTHGEIVLGKLTTPELLNEFNIRWRKHFVEVMDPKFLPEYWQIDRIFSLSSD